MWWNSVLSFLHQNKVVIELITSLCTIFATFFAYLAARRSLSASRSPYIPRIAFEDAQVFAENEKSYFKVINRSESSSAIAQSVEVKFSGGKKYYLGDIHPGFDNRIQFEDKFDITGKSGKLVYRDILGRKYKARFAFGWIIFKRSEIEDKARNIEVKLKYKKLNI
jgi:hypothetical protein